VTEQGPSVSTNHSPHERRDAPAGRRLHPLAKAARLAGPPAVLAIVATAALAAVAVTLEGSRGTAINIWLLAIGGLLTWTGLRALAVALPTAGASAFDSVRVRPVEPPSKLYEVIDIEGVILDAEWSLSGAEFRLRPLLRRIAASRLIERHQVDIETDPVAAHLLLGDELWALVEPEALSTEARTARIRHDRGRRGIPRATIRRAIDLLEAL
jgi:hypothetical protein